MPPAICNACSMGAAAALRGTSTPISARRAAKSARSSVSSMLAMGVPRTETWNRLKTPFLASSRPQFNAGWPAKPERDRMGSRARDRLRDETRRYGQEVDAVCKRLRSRDRGDVRIDEHRHDALLLQRLDRLAAGIVDRARLADLERAAAEDQHLHRIMPTNSSKRWPQSTGPGAASGWNWTLMNGNETW